MKKLLFNVAFLLVMGFLLWLNCWSANPLMYDGAFFWGIVISGLCVINFIPGLFQGLRENVVVENGRVVGLPKFPKIPLLIAVLPWAYIFVMTILPSPIFGTGVYRNQIGEPEVREFTADVSPIDMNQLPVVDQQLAYKLADKKLGEDPTLGSQVTLGEPTIQLVNGKLVWAVPLQHSGFFKWLSNTDGAAGYIKVSATNQKDVEYVEDYKLKYQAGAYFNDNIYRYVRISGGLFEGLSDYSFELDETGRPYWVVTTFKYLRGMGLPEATGVLIIDAENGESKKYNLSNIPEWVDRIQPGEYITDQINNRGNYIHGLFNFSNLDKFQTSEGYAIIYSGGKSYYFTGITSVGMDESSIGFMLVNMKTKEATRYNMSGATEYSAQQSAEGKVQHLGYMATFPLIINTDGIPTYFMTLKDKEGLVKQYAFVSVSDYTSVGTGESIRDALTDYKRALAQDGMVTVPDGTADEVTVEGFITRIAFEAYSDTAIYKIILNEYPDMIFIAPAALSQELALSRDGDKVSLTYTDSPSGIITLTAFDNLNFRQK